MAMGEPTLSLIHILGQQFEDEYQHQSSNDPVQVLLLLFIHICTLLFSGFWAAMRLSLIHILNEEERDWLAKKCAAIGA